MEVKLFIISLLRFALDCRANFLDGDKLKILINSPSIAKSHSNFHDALAEKLSKKGHQVVILCVDINPRLNYTGPKNDKTIGLIKVKSLFKDPVGTAISETNMFDGSHNMFLNGLMAKWARIMNEVCDELTRNEQLVKRLIDERFDLAISEEFDSCAFGLFHHIGIPTKVVSNSIPLHINIAYLYGIPYPASYVPNLFAPSYDPPYMSFFNRARAFFYNYVSVIGLNAIFTEQQAIFEKNIGHPFPSIYSIMRNTSLVFNNQFDLLDLPHPTSAKVVNVGGICFEPPKPVEHRIQQVMKLSSHGVVYVAFGRIVNSSQFAPLEHAMINVFGQFADYTFIWSGGGQTDAAQKHIRNTSNIFTYESVDQVSILHHPKTKLFITHCGVNSYMESAWEGKPMVGIPFFADQLYNCASMKNRGMGVCLDVSKIPDDPTILYHAIRSVLYMPEFTTNAEHIMKKLHDSPFLPEDKFVKNIEYVAKFKNMEEFNLPFYDEIGVFEYYSLDLVFAAMGTLMVLSLTLVLWPIHLYLNAVCFPSQSERM